MNGWFVNILPPFTFSPSLAPMLPSFLALLSYNIETSKEPVCPRVELIFKIIIILLIIFLGFIKSKPC